MSKTDWIFVLANVTTICLGLALPGLGESFEIIPKLGMVVQLLLCFLASTNPQLPLSREKMRGMTSYLTIKMLVLPLVMWGLFYVTVPEFAFAALLLSGSAVGAMGPTIAFMLRGDVLFSVGAVIISSFLMSLTLPSLSWLVSLVTGVNSEGLWLVFFKSAVFLFFYMFFPFCAAKSLWSKRPDWATAILRQRFGWSVSAGAIASFIIFSRYGHILRADVSLLWKGFGAACVLAVLLWAAGLLIWRKGSAEARLPRVVGATNMNNIMIVIVSMQFFGPHEILLAAFYSFPFSMLIILHQWAARRMRAKEALAQGSA